MLGRLRLARASYDSAISAHIGWAAAVLPLVLALGGGCTDVEHTGSSSAADTIPKEKPENLLNADPCRDGAPAPCVPKSERSSWQQIVTDRVPYVGYTVNVLTGNVDPSVCLAKTCAAKDNGGGVGDPGSGPGSEEGLRLEDLQPLGDAADADPCRDYAPCDRVDTTVQAFLSSVSSTESLVNSVGGSLNFSAGGGTPWLSGSVGASVASEYRTANNAMTTRVNGGLIGFTGLLMPKKPVLADKAKNELRKAYGTDAGAVLKQKRALGFLKLCKMGYVYGTAPAAYVDIVGKKTMSEVQDSGEFNAGFEAEVKSVYASGSVKTALKTMKDSKSGKSDFEATATLRGITMPDFAATVDLSTDPEKKIDDMFKGMVAQLNASKTKPDKPGPVMIANYKHTEHEADDDEVLDEAWKIGRFLQNRLREFDRAIGVAEFESEIAQLISGPAKWRFNYPSEPGNLNYTGVDAFLKAVDAAREGRVANGKPVTGPEWSAVVDQTLADTWNAKKENRAVAYSIADIPDMPSYVKKFNDLKDALRKARSACNEDIDNGFKKCVDTTSIAEALNWANIFYVHRPVMLNAVEAGYAHSRTQAMKMCADKSTDDRKLVLIGATPENKLFPAPDKADKDEVNANRTWAFAMFNFGARWARNEFGRIAQKSKSPDKTGMFWVGAFVDPADLPKGQTFYGRVLASRQDSFVKPKDVADADWHPEKLGWQIQSVIGNTTNFGYEGNKGFKAICVTVNPTGASKLSGAFSNPFSDRQLIDDVIKGK